MNPLRNTFVAVAASAALVGGVADSYGAEFTEAEKETLAQVDEFNACVNEKAKNATREERRAVEERLREQYADDIDQLRETLTAKYPRARPVEIEGKVEQSIRVNIDRALRNEKAPVCVDELQIDREELKQEYAEIKRKYPAVFPSQ